MQESSPWRRRPAPAPQLWPRVDSGDASTAASSRVPPTAAVLGRFVLGGASAAASAAAPPSHRVASAVRFAWAAPDAALQRAHRWADVSRRCEPHVCAVRTGANGGAFSSAKDTPEFGDTTGRGFAASPRRLRSAGGTASDAGLGAPGTAPGRDLLSEAQRRLRRLAAPPPLLGPTLPFPVPMPRWAAGDAPSAAASAAALVDAYATTGSPLGAVLLCLTYPEPWTDGFASQVATCARGLARHEARSRVVPGAAAFADFSAAAGSDAAASSVSALVDAMRAYPCARGPAAALRRALGWERDTGRLFARLLEAAMAEAQTVLRCDAALRSEGRRQSRRRRDGWGAPNLTSRDSAVFDGEGDSDATDSGDERQRPKLRDAVASLSQRSSPGPVGNDFVFSTFAIKMERTALCSGCGALETRPAGALKATVPAGLAAGEGPGAFTPLASLVAAWQAAEEPAGAGGWEACGRCGCRAARAWRRVTQWPPVVAVHVDRFPTAGGRASDAAATAATDATADDGGAFGDEAAEALRHACAPRVPKDERAVGVPLSLHLSDDTCGGNAHAITGAGIGVGGSSGPSFDFGVARAFAHNAAAFAPSPSAVGAAHRYELFAAVYHRGTWREGVHSAVVRGNADTDDNAAAGGGNDAARFDATRGFPPRQRPLHGAGNQEATPTAGDEWFSVCPVGGVRRISVASVVSEASPARMHATLGHIELAFYRRTARR